MQKGIKILALTMLAALSVMAVTAAGAQAAGKLRVEGKVLATGEEAELSGEGGAGKLLVPGLKLTIECKKSLVTGGGSNINIGGIEHFHAFAHVLYHECVVVENKFCTVYPTAADRTAKTNAGLILASALVLELLAEIEPGVTFHYLYAEQLAGKPSFATIFLGGSLCTLPAENEVKGATAFKLPTWSTESVEQELADISEKEEGQIEKATGKSLKLKYGNEPATLDEGNGKGHLIGKFATKKFSLD